MDESTAAFASMSEETGLSLDQPPASRLRKYRGGFTTSICDIFRDPHRRTDCCAVACCGVLASDRTRYLVTGKRPPPLFVRVLAYLVVPALFVSAMNYLAVDVPVEDGGNGSSGGKSGGDQGGDKMTQKVAPAWLLWTFIAYIIIIVTYVLQKNQSTRKEIMAKLYEERAGERGEEVDPSQLNKFLSRHTLDTIRAHCCLSCCYRHDNDFYDETTGVVRRQGPEGDDDLDHDFCTRLWDWLASVFWCCGCWFQCCGICALAQEEREVNRLTGNEGHKIDYLTFQPYSEYYPSIQSLREEQSKNPLKHIRAISDLSSTLLKNVAAVLTILIILALSNIDENFTWGNMIVLLFTLGQAFFIEYLVHWSWNLFDLSFDSVVKYFACGFLLTTPIALVVETLVSILVSALSLVLASLVIATDNELANELGTDPKKAMNDILINHPELFVFYNLLNAFIIAALTEEMVKYFGYRMVVTPDLIPGDSSALSLRHNNIEESGSTDGRSGISLKSTGAGVTVAMVSVALGFACCENLMYIFVYAPPSLGTEIETLVARSLFPVHPLCAAVQSIGVCKRDLEGDKKTGLGRIIFPAILLHGSFDFVLMISAYFEKRKDAIEGNDGDDNAGGDSSEDLATQLPALITSFLFVVLGYACYVFQSRAQTRRLIAIDSAMRDQNSPLI